MGRIGHPELDDRYEALKLLDTGGTSQVYLVQDRRLNCQWAIKKTKKQANALNTIMTEAEILKSLNHPALPRIVDIREDERFFYIVMDYIQGENLRTILRADGAQDQDTVVQWGIEICDVLAYLHKHNVVYRDMKPANIMLTPDGQIKLIDFGIAREYDPNAAEDTVALGTEGYAAPEQYEGHGQSDARTDIFGVGVTLFQLLTNINPATYTENLFSIRLANPSLSSGLDRVILKCTNKSKEKRYQNMAELKDALKNYRSFDIEVVKSNLKHKRLFIVFTALSIVCFVISGASRVLYGQQMGQTYESLMATNDTNNIKKAIALQPRSQSAYKKLLDSYGEEFTKSELSDFASIYADNQGQTSDEISMYAGEKILTSYEEKSLRSKLLTAEPYFSAVGKSYEKYPAAHAYTQLADFYKQYIMQDAAVIVKEAGQSELKSLLKCMKSLIWDISEYENAERNNLLLISCEMCLNIINEEADLMKTVGISKGQVMEPIDSISTAVKYANPTADILKKKKTSVSKQIASTKKLLNEVYS